jgi:putative inorganic carbon (HCO3(-)) transporter
LEKIVDKLPQNWINLPGASSGFNSNEVAGVLLWSLPLAFLLAYIIIFRKSDLENVLSDRAIRILRFLAIMGPFLLVFILLLTQSRSALIGITFSLSFMFIVLVTRNHAKWLKVLLPILLIILVTGSYLFLKIESAPNGAIDDNNSELGLSFLEARQEIWSRALYGIGDFPITGMGMGTFRRVVQVLYPLFVISPNVDIGHAHNHFLQTALDLGIIGLIAYVSLWIGIGVALLQSWKNSSSSLVQDLYLGLSGCLIAYFIYGVTDTVALGARPGFMFWSLLGLVIAGYRFRGDVI